MTKGWARSPDSPGEFPVRSGSSDKKAELGRQVSDRQEASLSLKACALRADVRRG